MLQEFLEETARKIHGRIVPGSEEVQGFLLEMKEKYGLWICPCSVVVEGYTVKRCPCKEGIADVREGRKCHCGIFEGAK